MHSNEDPAQPKIKLVNFYKREYPNAQQVYTRRNDLITDQRKENKHHNKVPLRTHHDDWNARQTEWVCARMGWPYWKCTDGSHQHNTEGKKADTSATHSKTLFLSSSKARVRTVHWEWHDGGFWDGGSGSRSFLTWCWLHGCHQLVKFMELIMCNLCVFLHVYKTLVKIPLRKCFRVHSLH